MLDLIDIKRWEIRLPCGDILRVKMPTIGRLKEIQETLLFISGDATAKEVERSLYNMLLIIFNDNTDGKVFDVADLEGMLQPNHLYMIVEDYMKYCNVLKKK